VPFRTLH